MCFVLCFFCFFKVSAGQLERCLQAVAVPSDKQKTSKLIVLKNLCLKSVRGRKIPLPYLKFSFPATKAHTVLLIVVFF